MLFKQANKWELCKNGAVVAAVVRDKSKTLVLRMEALGVLRMEALSYQEKNGFMEK